jgi:hypothetical protein
MPEAKCLGIINPMAVFDPPDTEAVECKIWYSRARVKQDEWLSSRREQQ